MIMRLSNPYNGMPDRDRYLDTPYVLTDVEKKLAAIIDSLFMKIFGLYGSS